MQCTDLVDAEWSGVWHVLAWNDEGFAPHAVMLVLLSPLVRNGRRPSGTPVNQHHLELIIIIISCIHNAPNDTLSANRIHIP